jgi:hypothetical protein
MLGVLSITYFLEITLLPYLHQFSEKGENGLITRVAGMSKGEEGSILAVINGELTWLPPPTGDGKFFLTFSDGALAWEKGQEWSCP